MKTIILTLIIFLTSIQVNAQNISKLFGNDLARNRHLNFERSSDTSEVFVSYDANKEKTEQDYFFLVSEKKGISCLVFNDGTIKTAFIDYVLQESNGIDPDVVISVEIVPTDRFIHSYIKPIVDEFLQNLSTYDKIKEYGKY